MLNEQNYFFSFVLNFEENYEGVFDKEFKIFYDKINSRFSNNNFEIVIINNQYNSKSIALTPLFNIFFNISKSTQS